MGVGGGRDGLRVGIREGGCGGLSGMDRNVDIYRIAFYIIDVVQVHVDLSSKW